MKRQIIRIAILGLAVPGFVAVGIRSAFADTVSITANHDATIIGGSTSNANGSGAAIFVGTNTNVPPGANRGLVEFDVADNVPSGATITGVQLSLYLGMQSGTGGGTGGGGGGGPGAANVPIELHKLLVSWSEGPSESLSHKFSGTGNGQAAVTGDATWIYRSFSSLPWGAAGGLASTDYSSAASGTAIVGATTESQYLWTSSDTGNGNMLADVQNWYTTPSSNFGWMLIGDETVGDAPTQRAFYSKDATLNMQGNGTAIDHSWWPTLTITYTTVPEPSGFVLAGLALSALVVAGRRRVAG